MFNNFFNKFSKEIGIDLGTANTLIYTRDKGIVVNEPTVVAINTRTDQILAVGKEAKQMLGKTPPHIQVIKPLQEGVISDYEVTEKMLRYFFDKIYEQGFSFLNRPRVVICSPLDTTEVEIKAIEDATLSAGAREVYVIHEPMASAIGARMPIQDAVGNMIVDIGGGNTEIAVISLCGVVNWKSTNIAGDEMNKNIIQYAREMFNLLVGDSHAEQIKIQIGTAMEVGEEAQLSMRGRDVLTGLPKEVKVTSSDIREALSRSVQTIVEYIKMTLEITPPELTADIHQRGILLTGGGSLLRGLDKLITKTAEIPVKIVDDPLTTVVRGTGILLEDKELLTEVSIQNDNPLK